MSHTGNYNRLQIAAGISVGRMRGRGWYKPSLLTGTESSHTCWIGWQIGNETGMMGQAIDKFQLGQIGNDLSFTRNFEPAYPYGKSQKSPPFPISVVWISLSKELGLVLLILRTRSKDWPIGHNNHCAWNPKYWVFSSERHRHVEDSVKGREMYFGGRISDQPYSKGFTGAGTCKIVNNVYDNSNSIDCRAWGSCRVYFRGEIKANHTTQRVLLVAKISKIVNNVYYHSNTLD